MRYFLLRDKFARFDKYPNPTKLVEGVEPIINTEI